MSELVRPGSYRQSLIAAFDSCPRRALYSILDERRTPSAFAARGTLFHRFHHQAINLMREKGERRLPVEIGMEMLVDVLAQVDVSPDEIVPLTMAEMRWLRVLVAKWCMTMELSIDRLVDVERRLFADLVLPSGEIVQITGQLDTLFSGPGEFVAGSLDAKSGMGRPKKPRGENGEEAKGGLTELGWVQAHIYAHLVFQNYPSIQRFWFREWHVLWAESRELTVERYESERLQDVLVAQVSLLHTAIQEGAESPRWVASPGPHCALCSGVRLCPIREQVGIPADEEEARLLAGEWFLAGEARKERLPLLKGWVEEHGPVEVRFSRGRRYVGWDSSEVGRRSFGLIESPDPEPNEELDAFLLDALRDRGVEPS